MAAVAVAVADPSDSVRGRGGRSKGGEWRWNWKMGRETDRNLPTFTTRPGTRGVAIVPEIFGAGDGTIPRAAVHGT